MERWTKVRLNWRRLTLGNFVIWTFILALAWTPFWYGSNILLAWGVNAVLFPGLAAIYEVGLLVRGARHPVGIRHIAAPAALFCVAAGWAVLQAIPGDSIPFAHPVWALASETLGRPLRASISINRSLTELALLRLVACASVFWLALQLCRNGARALLFLNAFAVIAGLYACYGLLTLAFGQLPWLNIPMADGRVSSTFSNYNSYATYAGLGLLVSVALLIERFGATIRGTSSSWRHQIIGVIEVVSQKAPILVAIAFLMAVTLMLSGSRGGIAATAFGFACYLIVAPRRQKGARRWGVVSGILVLCLVLAMVLAFGDAFFRRLETGGISDPNRLAVYRLTWRSILDAPWTGFGYGTFVEVFPMYRDNSIGMENFWAQAHSTYLEIFQGLGFVFGGMLILSVGLLAFRCAQGVFARRENNFIPRVAVAAAILAGLHTSIDFSLQMQAVALALMALLGAGVAQSVSSRTRLED